MCSRNTLYKFFIRLLQVAAFSQLKNQSVKTWQGSPNDEIPFPWELHHLSIIAHPPDSNPINMDNLGSNHHKEQTGQLWFPTWQSVCFYPIMQVWYRFPSKIFIKKFCLCLLVLTYIWPCEECGISKIF